MVFLCKALHKLFSSAAMGNPCMLSHYFPHYLGQQTTSLANYPLVSFELLNIMLMSFTSCIGGDSEQLLQTDFPFGISQISIIPSFVPFLRSKYCLDTYYLVPCQIVLYLVQRDMSVMVRLPHTSYGRLF